MQYNIESYIAEKEARERRVLVYTEKIQERMLYHSSEIIKKLVEERHRQNMTGDRRHYGSVAIESGAIRERKQDSYACSTGKICKRPGKAYRHKNL